MSATIYLIHSNNNPEKFYIGSSINFLRRKGEHIKGLEKQKHHCKHLQSAYKKYGKETFKFYILEYVKDLSKLLDREDYYLQDFFWFDDELYNECFIAGSRIFTQSSEETKRKISQNHIDVSGKNNPNFGKHPIPWNKGKTNIYSKETKKKMSLVRIGKIPWNKGIPRTKEEKAKISLSKKGKTIVWNKGLKHSSSIHNSH